MRWQGRSGERGRQGEGGSYVIDKYWSGGRQGGRKEERMVRRESGEKEEGKKEGSSKGCMEDRKKGRVKEIAGR